MGIGQYPAGVGPCGFDPVHYVAPSPVATLPRAVQWDPSTQRYTVNADGSMVDIHPIDQQVAILLTREQGTIPSAPTLGQRIRLRVQRAPLARIPSIVLDEVQMVLKTLIANGDIRLLGVDVDTTVPGRAISTVRYVNLRLPTHDPNFPLANVRSVVLS